METVRTTRGVRIVEVKKYCVSVGARCLDQNYVSKGIHYTSTIEMGSVLQRPALPCPPNEAEEGSGHC